MICGLCRSERERETEVIDLGSLAECISLYQTDEQTWQTWRFTFVTKDNIEIVIQIHSSDLAWMIATVAELTNVGDCTSLIQHLKRR